MICWLGSLDGADWSMSRSFFLCQLKCAHIHLVGLNVPLLASRVHSTRCCSVWFGSLVGVCHWCFLKLSNAISLQNASIPWVIIAVWVRSDSWPGICMLIRDCGRGLHIKWWHHWLLGQHCTMGIGWSIHCIVMTCQRCAWHHSILIGNVSGHEDIGTGDWCLAVGMKDFNSFQLFDQNRHWHHCQHCLPHLWWFCVCHIWQLSCMWDWSCCSLVSFLLVHS